MKGREHNAVRPLGVCRRLYNFAMAIFSSRAIAYGYPSNNGNSEIKIEFPEAIQKGKKMKIGSAEDNNVKIKFKTCEKQAQGEEPSFVNGVRERGGTRRETRRSSGKVKQTHSKETSLNEEEDEDAKVLIPQQLLPSRVFSNIDSRAEDFIRSRLEAMQRSH